MADKKPLIVIKKITIEEAGGHGGAWKVAFADFMTALMAFFLVMWLIASASPQAKENVSDYFSTPSIIEYNFANYGVELTLEKLFLDLINEPLKFFQQFMTPVDKTPNIMDMGLKKVVVAHLANQLEDYASDVSVTGDAIQFEIPDTFLFEPGTSIANSKFVEVMDKIKTITAGLEFSTVQIDSIAYLQSVKDNKRSTAQNVATERADIVLQRIQSTLEHESVELVGRAIVDKSDKPPVAPAKLVPGKIQFLITQRKDLAPQKPLKDTVFGKSDSDESVYNNFVKNLTEKKRKK